MEWLDSFFAIFGLYRKPVPRQKRTCQRCGKQIKRSDRWTHAVNGKPEHWNCESTRDCPKKIIYDLKQIPTDEQQVLPLEGQGNV